MIAGGWSVHYLSNDSIFADQEDVAIPPPALDRAAPPPYLLTFDSPPRMTTCGRSSSR